MSSRPQKSSESSTDSPKPSPVDESDTNSKSTISSSSSGVRGGSKDALPPEVWLDTYGDYLYSCALRYVKDPNVAEEMVQDGLLSAYKALDSFQQKSSLKTWLGTIVKNKSLDYLRRASRETKIFAPVQSDDESAVFSSIGRWKTSIPSWGRDPEAALGDKRMREALLACIDKLSTRQRAIFSMRVVDGSPIDEICKQLDISPSNASVILYRARMQLRECMDTTWFNAEKIGT